MYLSLITTISTNFTYVLSGFVLDIFHFRNLFLLFIHLYSLIVWAIHAGLHKQWPQLHEHHNHWRRVLGARVRPGTRHFPYNENPKRTLNIASLKRCLISIDAIDRREKIHTCVWRRFKVASFKCVSLKSTSFSQKAIRSDNFLTEQYMLRQRNLVGNKCN